MFIFNPILQTKKLRFGKIKELAPGNRRAEIRTYICVTPNHSLFLLILHQFIMPFLFLTKEAEKGWIGNTNGLSLKVSQV